METASNLLLFIKKMDVNPEIDNERIYIGLTEDPFKWRLSDHCTSFKY